MLSCKRRRFGVFVDTDKECRRQQIEVNKFKVTYIPDTMDKKGWKVSSALMRHWFNNGNHGWTLDMKENFKDMDALQLTTSEYNDKIVTMKWAMQFSQVKDNINTLIALVNEQNGTLNQLLRRLKRKGWIKGSVKTLEKIDNVRVFEDGNQIQFLTIGNKENPLDDYLGALANATLKVGLVGTTTKDDKFVVEKYGIYIKDSYDFTDEPFLKQPISQPLGYWSKDDVEKYPFFDSTYITNDDFMEYRSKNLKGGDFFVFSNILWIDAPKNTVLDIKGSACDDT